MFWDDHDPSKSRGGLVFVSLAQLNLSGLEVFMDTRCPVTSRDGLGQEESPTKHSQTLFFSGNQDFFFSNLGQRKEEEASRKREMPWDTQAGEEEFTAPFPFSSAPPLSPASPRLRDNPTANAIPLDDLGASHGTARLLFGLSAPDQSCGGGLWWQLGSHWWCWEPPSGEPRELG